MSRAGQAGVAGAASFPLLEHLNSERVGVSETAVDTSLSYATAAVAVNDDVDMILVMEIH